MMVFADAPALFALLMHNDLMHGLAKSNFEHIFGHNCHMVSSSYVLLETVTLLQRRVSLAAELDFNQRIEPLLEVVWADES